MEFWSFRHLDSVCMTQELIEELRGDSVSFWTWRYSLSCHCSCLFLFSRRYHSAKIQYENGICMYPCYHRNEVLSSSISWCVSKNSSNNNFNLIEYRYRSRLNTRLQCQIDDIMILMDLLSSHEKVLVAAIGWNCSFGLWSLQSTRTNERRYRRTADIRHSAGNVALALERACAK